jgi:hypothetical protein
MSNQNHSNYLVSNSVIRVWDQKVCPPVVSGSSSVVVNMMAIGDLYDP